MLVQQVIQQQGLLEANLADRVETCVAATIARSTNSAARRWKLWAYSRGLQERPVQQSDFRRCCREACQKRSGMSLSGRQGGHQRGEPDEIEPPPEIVGERGQAEFGTNLLQATH